MEHSPKIQILPMKEDEIIKKLMEKIPQQVIISLSESCKGELYKENIL